MAAGTPAVATDPGGMLTDLAYRRLYTSNQEGLSISLRLAQPLQRGDSTSRWEADLRSIGCNNIGGNYT